MLTGSAFIQRCCACGYRYEEAEVKAEPAAPPAAAIGPDDLPADWREKGEERAAIREYDGGWLKQQGEDLALQDVLQQMQQARDRADTGCPCPGCRSSDG